MRRFFAPKWKFRISLVAFIINLLPMGCDLLTDFESVDLREMLGIFTGLLLGLVLIRLVDRKTATKKPERINLQPLSREAGKNTPESDS